MTPMFCSSGTTMGAAESSMSLRPRSTIEPVGSDDDGTESASALVTGQHRLQLVRATSESTRTGSERLEVRRDVRDARLARCAQALEAPDLAHVAEPAQVHPVARARDEGRLEAAAALARADRAIVRVVEGARRDALLVRAGGDGREVEAVEGAGASEGEDEVVTAADERDGVGGRGGGGKGREAERVEVEREGDALRGRVVEVGLACCRRALVARRWREAPPDVDVAARREDGRVVLQRGEDRVSEFPQRLEHAEERETRTHPSRLHEHDRSLPAARTRAPPPRLVAHLDDPAERAHLPHPAVLAAQHDVRPARLELRDRPERLALRQDHGPRGAALVRERRVVAGEEAAVELPPRDDLAVAAEGVEGPAAGYEGDGRRRELDEGREGDGVANDEGAERRRDAGAVRGEPEAAVGRLLRASSSGSAPCPVHRSIRRRGSEGSRLAPHTLADDTASDEYRARQPARLPLASTGNRKSRAALRCHRISHGPPSPVMKRCHSWLTRARATRSRGAMAGRSESTRRSLGSLLKRSGGAVVIVCE